MVTHVLFMLLFCALLRTASLNQWKCDLQVQESRNFLSEAKVKSIQDILLLRDSYSPNTPHNPQSSLPHHDYRPHQDINPSYIGLLHYPGSVSSRYRPHQTQGYEIHEEPDLPGTSVLSSDAYMWIPDSASAKGNLNLQKMKPGLSASDLSYYPYTAVTLHGDGKKHKIQPSVPSVKLTYQGTPTQFQGNMDILPNSRVSSGQHLQAPTVVPAQVIERPHTPHGTQPRVNRLAALLLASSLSQLPVISA
jgi:hypothetical protein